MKLYRLVDDDTHTWHGVRSDAQAKGKETAPALRGALRVQECNVETDKAGVVKALNSEPVIQIIRVWKMSNRGGLVEIPK